MARDFFEERRRGGGFVWALLFVVAAAVAFFLWGALRRGPAPEITIESDHAAVGRETRVLARFKEPARGLGVVRLELVQQDRVIPLGEKRFPRKGPFSLFRGHPTEAAELTALIGRDRQDWL